MTRDRSTESPRLDHVSLIGDGASFEELGFRVTATSGSSDHGRIFLDHAYLEVTRPPAVEQGIGSRGWFLRPPDVSAAARALRAAGLTVEGPDPYRGRDGDWLDVVTVDQRTKALPIITRRIDSEEWPPALDAPHPNGAFRLSGLRLRLVDPAPLFRSLEAIGVRQEERDVISLPGDTRIEVESTLTEPEGVVSVFVGRPDGSVIEIPVEPRTD